MTKVSRWPLNEAKETEIYDIFVHSFARLGSPGDLGDFLDDLLSPTEKLMLGKRLFIAILLSKGLTYEEIRQAVHASPPTINSVGYNLRGGRSGYRKVIEKIIHEEKIESFLDKVSESLLRAFPKRYGSAGFLAKQKEGKEIYRRRKNRLFVK